MVFWTRKEATLGLFRTEPRTGLKCFRAFLRGRPPNGVKQKNLRKEVSSLDLGIKLTRTDGELRMQALGGGRE